MQALKKIKNKYNLVVFSIFAILILFLLLYAAYKSRGLVKKNSLKLKPTVSVTRSKEEIILDKPGQGENISSPLKISGRARGSWFFEGTFPVVLTDWDGNIIAQGYATTEGDWMTEKLVPFTAIIDFVRPAYGDNGNLILRKANPSGLPENDKALETVIFFKK